MPDINHIQEKLEKALNLEDYWRLVLLDYHVTDKINRPTYKQRVLLTNVFPNMLPNAIHISYELPFYDTLDSGEIVPRFELAMLTTNTFAVISDNKYTNLINYLKSLQLNPDCYLLEAQNLNTYAIKSKQLADHEHLVSYLAAFEKREEQKLQDARVNKILAQVYSLSDKSLEKLISKLPVSQKHVRDSI